MFKFVLLQIIELFTILHQISCCCSEIDIEQKMIEHFVIPDLIPKPPTHKLKIFYPIGQDIKEVETGQHLFEAQTRCEPWLKWPIKTNKSYTLFMSIRAPIYELSVERAFNPSLGNQTHVQWPHWVAVNIPGIRIVDGAELQTYSPLKAPAPNTRDLVSIFVWEQPHKYESFKYDKHMGAREIYGDRNLVQNFAKQFQLGTPWAGDFFFLKYLA